MAYRSQGVGGARKGNDNREEKALHISLDGIRLDQLPRKTKNEIE